MGDSRKILIGITGGIAAYKIPLLVRLLRKNGCEVKCVLTQTAKTLVGIDALRTVSGNIVYTDGESQHDMNHIRLSEWADTFAICPATANTIAKMNYGIADNLLTTLALSIPDEKIIVAPAMNCVMWESKATQRNVSALKERGVNVLPVETGVLACGVEGQGRMLDIEDIAKAILGAQEKCPRLLDGKKVLISSGPTEEFIDPVRVITNKSSGKMGAALASVAMSMGAEVIVVSGPASVDLPKGASVVNVKTACEMEREMQMHFETADVCVMAAAVSDYRVVNPSSEKIHRAQKEKLTLELVQNPDILATLGAKKTTQFLVGFALENEDCDVTRAKEKMKRKNCDMMILNSVNAALGGDDTKITVLQKDGDSCELPSTSKRNAAVKIFEKIANALGDGK